jgi:O-antigen ligase
MGPLIEKQSLLSRLWIGLIISVPIIPKVAVFHAAGTIFLLDDFALICGICLGGVDLLGPAAIGGRGRLFTSRVGIVLALAVAYKAVDLLFLSLFYPWGDLSMRGSALLFTEGVLVLVRISAIAAVYLLFFHFLRNLKDTYLVVQLYGLTVIVVVVIGLLQHFLLGHPIMTSTFRNIHALGQIIPGIWGAENPWLDASATGHEHLGAFMILALSIICGCLAYQWPLKIWHRNIVIILGLAGVYVLLMASSRGAWVGILCAGIAFFFLAINRGKQVFLNRLVFLLALSTVCLYFAGFNFGSNIISRVDKLPSILEGEMQDNSGSHRLVLLENLWMMFLEKPVLGWGAGGAGRIAEGQIIRELVEGGVIGGFIFLALMVVSYKMAIGTNRVVRDPLAKGLSLGFACGLIGLVGHCLFTELFVLPKVSVPFWAIAAVVHRLYFIETKGRGEL